MSSEKPTTRTRILEAAWRLLESGQAEGVRMADIAKEAGISRQAVYLHFPTRAELLVATTRHLDEVKHVDARLAASRSAASGVERLSAYIDAWGNYIPEIHGVAKALLAMENTDEEAAAAWSNRMQAMRQGCEAAVRALARDGTLTRGRSEEEATDLLWTLLSVRTWEQLVHDCGWSQALYIKTMQELARRSLVRESD